MEAASTTPDSATEARSGMAVIGSRPGPFGITPGWYNVAVSLLVAMLLVGSTSYSFGLFVKPVAAEFGLGRANVNIGLILFQIGSAVYSPFIGRIADRHSARAMIRISGILLGGGLIAIGLASWLPLLAFLMGVPIAIGAGMGSIAGMVVVSRWFRRLRGRALTISALGTSAGGLITFPAIAFLLGHFGWRSALLITGSAIIILVWLLSRLVWDAPAPAVAAEATRRHPASTEADEREWRAPELLRHRDFWLIAISIALMLSVDGAALATLPPYALDRGFSLTDATLLMTAATSSAILGKLTIAWFVDRMDLRLLIGITGSFAVILCLTMMVQPSYTLLIAVCALTGLAIGGTYPLSNAIVAERFGVISLGIARGLMMPLTSALVATSLYLVGALHDHDGDYRRAFAILAVASFIAIILIFFTGRAKSHPRGATSGDHGHARA